jgi:hypothetical protein
MGRDLIQVGPPHVNKVKFNSPAFYRRKHVICLSTQTDGDIVPKTLFQRVPGFDLSRLLHLILLDPVRHLQLACFVLGVYVGKLATFQCCAERGHHPFTRHFTQFQK